MRSTLRAVAKIMRTRALDSLPTRQPACPAAARVDGISPRTCGVVCRVIAQDRQKEAGLDVNPAQLAIAREGGHGDTFLSIEEDPSTVRNLCFGTGIPVLDDREVPGNRDSFTYCPTWQAEYERRQAGRDQLAGGGLAEPPKVSHWDDGRGSTREAPAGSSYDSPDPWKQARRDLDVLAPPAGA